MAYSYEEWKKRNNNRKKPSISAPIFSEFKARYQAEREAEKPKQEHWQTVDQWKFDSQPKTERARQADADRFAARYIGEEEQRKEKINKARQAEVDKENNARQAVTDKENKVRQANSDRFAGRYTSEQTRRNNEILNVPTSQIMRHIEKPVSRKEEKVGLLSRVFENAKKLPLNDPEFHKRNAEMEHQGESDMVKGFFNKDSKNDTLSGKAGANLRLGIGDAMESVAGGMRWLTAKKTPFGLGEKMPNLGADLLQKGADKVRDGFEDDAFDKEFEYGDWKNPEWLATQLPRALPQLLTSVIPGLGIGAAAGKLSKIQKLPKLFRTLIPPVAGGGAQAAIDATMEAGGVYDEALRRGMTDEQANDAANKAFKHNIELNAGMDITQFMLMLTPFRKLDDLGKVTSIGLRTAGGALTEGFQEGAQTGITANALGDDFKWSDPSTVEAMILGGILGGGVTGTVASGKAIKDSFSRKPGVDSPVTDILNRAADEMPQEIRAEFDQAVTELEEQGMPKEDALEVVSEQLLDRVPAFGEALTEITKEYVEDKKLEQQSTGLNSVSQAEENAQEEHVAKRLRNKKKRQQKKWLKNNLPQAPLDTPIISPEQIIPNVPSLPVPDVSLDASFSENRINTPEVVETPVQASNDVLNAPVDVQVGDTVNLEGTRAETEYIVEGVEGDSVQVLTPNRVSIKVPKSRIASVLNRSFDGEEEAFYNGAKMESSTISEEDSFPPNFRKDIRTALTDVMNEYDMTIEEAVEEVKADEYYAGSEWGSYIDEEAKAFGYEPDKFQEKSQPKPELITPNGKNEETGRPIYDYKLVGKKWIVIPLNAPTIVNGEPNIKKAYLHVRRGYNNHYGKVSDDMAIVDKGQIYIGADKSMRWEGKNIHDVFPDIPEYNVLNISEIKGYLSGEIIQFKNKEEEDAKIAAGIERIPQIKDKMFAEGNPNEVYNRMKDEWNKLPFEATHQRYRDKARTGREYLEPIQVLEFETAKGTFFTRRNEHIPFIAPAPINVLSKIAVPLNEVPIQETNPLPFKMDDLVWNNKKKKQGRIRSEIYPGDDSVKVWSEEGMVNKVEFWKLDDLEPYTPGKEAKNEVPKALESSIIKNPPFEKFDENLPNPKVTYEDIKSRLTAKFIPNGGTETMTLVFPKPFWSQDRGVNQYTDEVLLPKDTTVADINKWLNIKFAPGHGVKTITNTFDKMNDDYVPNRFGKKEINVEGELLIHPSEFTDQELEESIALSYEDSGLDSKKKYDEYMGYMRKELEKRKPKAEPKETPKPKEPKITIEDSHITVNGYSLKNPTKYTTADLESYAGGISFDESGMEDRKTFNKYMDLLDKELQKRYAQEDAAKEEVKKPSQSPKAPPKNVASKDMDYNKYEEVRNNLEWLNKMGEEARKRIESRKGRALAGLPMDDMVDYAIIGAGYLANKSVDMAEFTELMIRDFGENIKRFIPVIHFQSQEMLTMKPDELYEMIKLVSKEEAEVEGEPNNEVETDSDGPLETDGPGEIPGTKKNGTSGTGSNGGKRGNDKRGDGNISGDGQSGPTKGEQSAEHDATPEHDLETGGGSKSPSDIREPRRVKTNFRITDELDSFGSVNNRFANNIAAIKLIKQIEDEGRLATHEEQGVLARYVGWGGLSNAFNTTNDKWKKQYNILKELVDDGTITEQEYDEAKRTTQYAHYTSKEIIQSMYQALENMGVKGGRVLEPGMGIGNFFGLMPQEWKADLVGVEYDGITGRIAKQLYQKANVEVKPYEDFTIPNDYFDVAIGNPPFSRNTSTYKGEKLRLHNYFFVKSLDKVRPGGILAFVTSSGTMNSKDTTARKLMAEKADFLGAIRLPSDAFKANAGTEVTTDIIFFQKREEGAEPKDVDAYINTTEREVVGRDGKKVMVRDNDYFLRNGDMVLGDLTTDKLISSQEKPRLAVVSNGNFSEQFEAAIDKLPKNIYTESTLKVEKIEYADEIATSLTGLDEGNYAYENGQVVQMTEGRIVKRDGFTGAKLNRLKGLIQLRDAAKETLKLQATTQDKEKIDLSIKKLNFLYDGFVKKFKTINSTGKQRPNVNVMKQDPLGISLLLSLEKEVKGTYVKQDIFHGPVISYIPEIKNVESSEEALVVSLSQKGRIDLPYMKEISGLDEEKILADLGTRVFHNPKAGWEIQDEYLSGNVRIKLLEAKELAKTDKKYERNVKALEAVIPEDIHSDDIKVQFGTPWIPEQDYTDFVNSFFKAREKKATVRLIKQTGDWKIEGSIETPENRREHKISSQLNGGDSLTGLEIIALALNSKAPILRYVSGTTADGKPQRSVDQDATSLARLKLEELEGEFQDWLFSDKDREKRLTRKYNDEFNAVVLQEYDGELIYGGETDETSKPFAGGFNNAKYILRKHQKNVVWRMVQGGNTLLAHVVGAGKTLEMIVAGMEMKRLGLVRKPLYIVPNNLFDQWGRDFRDSYPNANILMLSTDLIPPVGVKKRQLEKPISKAFDLSTLGKEDKVSVTGSKKRFNYKYTSNSGVHLTDSDKKEIIVKRSDIKSKFIPEPEEVYKKRLNEARIERATALNKIAVGNYDAVILTHETFKKLPMSPEFNREFVREQLKDLELALIAMREDEGDSARTVKQMEQAKEALEEKLEGLMNEDGKDIAIPFEMLGIDQIFVDEAHKFKNLEFHTKLTRITGLSNTASQRSEDLYMKTRWLTKVRNGRGVVFATGTPISNTMAEMFTMQRYLQSDRLEELNVRHFDMWAKMFGETEASTEMDVAGGFKERTRFKRFRNIPELMTMFKEVTDIKTAPMLNLPRPKNVNSNTVVAPLSQQQRAYMDWIVSRANAVQSGTVDKKEDNWLKITGDARKMSLDIRLAAKNADEDPESKINLAVENIFKIWQDGKHERPDKDGKPIDNLTQLVFADLGTPKAKRQNDEGDDIEDDDDFEVLNFDVYNDMRDKLIKLGIPKEELVFIHEVKTPKQKEKLFKDVNSGKVRVLFGSTEKMGAGMNVQERLGALHHIDAPWRPSDVEQREGRMIRQGNKLDDVNVFQYVTEGSFDRIMWELLKNKAAFVEQVMNDDGSIREMEDVGVMELRFAHITAATTGDSTILDKMNIDKLVKDLRGAREQHRKKNRKNKRDLSEMPEKIAYFQSELSKIQADLKVRPVLDGPNFKMEIDGKVYEKRVEAGEALGEVFKKHWKALNPGQRVPIGKIGPFELSLGATTSSYGTNPTLIINGAGQYTATYNELSPVGSIARIENELDRMDYDETRFINGLESLKEEQINLTKTLDAPFKHEARLEKALKEQHELNQKMLKLNKSTEHVSSDEDEDGGNHEDTFFESKGIEQEKNSRKRPEYSQAPKETLDRTVTRPQIMAYVKKHFNVKVDYKKLRGKGVYKNKFAIIRVKHYGDFEVLAHELGHRIDTRLGLSAKKALQGELVKFAESNLELPKSLTELQKAHEGVAEYFRQVFYGTQNIEQQLAEEGHTSMIPFYEVSKELENAIIEGLNKHGWFNNVKELNGLIQSWLGRTPDQEWTGFTAKFGEESKDRDSVKRKFNKLYSGFLDENFPIKVAQNIVENDTNMKLMDDKNAYGMAVASRGTTARAVTFTEYTTFNTDFARTNGSYVETGEGLKAIFEDIQKVGDVDEFGQYVVAKHLYYLKTEKGKVDSPITISEDTELALKEGDSKYGALAERFYAFQRKMLRDILGAGNLVSEELIEKLEEEYPYYVSLARVKTETGEKGGIKTSSGSGFANKRQGIQRMSKFGSSSMIINPLESALNNVHVFMGLSDQNAVGYAMASWADPDSEFATESTKEIIEEINFDVSVKEVVLKSLEKTLLNAGLDEEIMEQLDMEKVHNIYQAVFKPNPNNNEIVVWKEGKPHLYKIHDAWLYNALIALENRFFTALITNPFAKPFIAAADVLVYGVTVTPFFTLSIFIRSYMQLIWKTRATGLEHALYFKQVAKSMNDVRKKNKNFREWTASGAGQSTFVASQTKYLNRFKKEVKYKQKTQKFMKGKYKPQDRTETLEIFKYMASNYGVGGALNKFQRFNDLLDSSLKMAEYEIIKRQSGNKLEAVIASRDADMDHKRQGNDFMKAWNKIDPFNRVAFQGLDAFARSVVENPMRQGMRGLLIFGLPTIILAMMNYDDEEYWELNSYERDLYWLFPKGDGTFYKQRIPFEVGLVFKTIPEKIAFEIMDFFKKQDKHSWKGFGENVRNTMLPAMIPFLLNIGIKYVTESDWTTGRPFVPMNLQGEKAELQYNESTSEIGKWIGGIVNKSPMVIDATIKGMTGTLGTWGVALTDLGLDAVGVVDRPDTGGLTRNYLDKFFTSSINDGSTASIDDFYDKKTEIEEEYQQQIDEGTAVSGRPSKLNRQYDRALEDLAALRKVRDGMLYDRLKQKGGSIFPKEEKKRRIDIANKAMTDIARIVAGKPALDQEGLEEAWRLIDGYNAYEKAVKKAEQKEYDRKNK